jgi:hypothetical protein
MNDQEWTKVRDTLLSAFPDLMTKLSFIGGAEQVAGTSRMWRETLKGCTAEECYRVIGQWVRGEKEPFRSNEWDRVALILKARIGGMRNEERLQNAPSKQKFRLRPNDSGFGVMSAIFAAIDARKSGDIDEAEVERLTEAALKQIPARDPLSGPRFNCRLCRDSGLVRVYREHSVNELKRDSQFAGIIDDNDMVACNCSAGEVYSNLSKPFPRYSDGRFCMVNGVTRSQQLAEIGDWIASSTKHEWVA